MKYGTKMLTAIAVVMMGASAAQAETVVKTTTTVTPEKTENTNMINFSAFDYNNDGILSMAEVGEKLFYIFDRDGNEVIDNIEFDQDSVMTITPMEKETVTLVDHYGDGEVDHATYTYETFLEESQLAKYAGDHDGLSPKEFIEQGFLETDINDDKAITIDEWKDAYLGRVMPESAIQERYN